MLRTISFCFEAAKDKTDIKFSFIIFETTIQIVIQAVVLLVGYQTKDLTVDTDLDLHCILKGTNQIKENPLKPKRRIDNLYK